MSRLKFFIPKLFFVAVSPFQSRKFMIPFSLFWFVWICAHQLALYKMGLDWFTALTDSVVSNTLLIWGTWLVFTILRYYLPRKEGIFNLFLLVIVLTAAWFFAKTFIMNAIYPKNSLYMQVRNSTLPLRIGIAFLINGCVTMFAYAYYNWQEKTEADKQKTEAEKLTREAELFKLRQQLQPHFLFNALNSINALISIKPDEARKMVQQLSEFLRTTLKKEEKQWVKLDEELHSLQLYLDIEKVRFGNRLSTRIEADVDALTMQLPALLLQPLVENAIKFGLYDTTESTQITITAKAVNNELKVVVENPFDAETSPAKKGTGFGLSSVQRRLFLLFGRNELLQTETKENIFITTVMIPQPQTINEEVQQ